MASFKEIASYDVNLTCDCAEWLETEDNGTLACATYQLDKETQTRLGELRLYRFEENLSRDSGNNCDKAKLSLLAATDSSGVFDIKFSSLKRKMLASATADGKCNIYTISSDIDPTLEAKGLQLTNKDSNAYSLSLDWNDRRGPQENTKVVVSRSDGYVSVVQIREEDLEISEDFLAHKYPYMDAGAEVWISAFDCWNGDIIYTGSDDAKLKMWDLKCGTSKPVFVNSTSHQAGVCSMQCSIHRENILVTGSYDNIIRIWDKRNLTKSLCSQIDAGGGVWRLKFHPQIDKHNLLLAACMRNGFRIYDIADRFGQTKDLDTEIGASVGSEEHNKCIGSFNNGFPKGGWETLGYGVDWITKGFSTSVESSDTYYIAGASFYDHTLRLFEWEWQKGA